MGLHMDGREHGEERGGLKGRLKLGCLEVPRGAPDGPKGQSDELLKPQDPLHSPE
jgi:hypothetical protein